MRGGLTGVVNTTRSNLVQKYAETSKRILSPLKLCSSCNTVSIPEVSEQKF